MFRRQEEWPALSNFIPHSLGNNKEPMSIKLKFSNIIDNMR